MDLKNTILSKLPYLDDSQYEAVSQYISNITISKNTSGKLAFDFHMKKIKNLIGNSDDKEKSEVSLEVEALLGFLNKDPYQLSKELAPHAHTRYNYLLLDTDNCYSVSDTRDKFMWLINDKIPVYQKGYINLHAPLKNIKMARLGRVSFTHMFIDDTISVTSGRRISFGFDEFTSQALIAPDGTRFQFLANLRPSDVPLGSNSVLSCFDQNRGWFRFRERFRILDKLSLGIRDLFASIPRNILIPDTYATFTGVQQYGIVTTVNEVDITNPLVVPSADYFLSNLVPEQVVLSGYTTLDPVGEAALIAAYNSVHTLTYVGLGYFQPPSPLGTMDFDWPTITITLVYKPRMLCVLELISEDETSD